MEVKDIKLHTVFINSSSKLCIIIEDRCDSFRILSIEGILYSINKQRDIGWISTWKLSDKSSNEFLTDINQLNYNTVDVKLEIDKLSKLVYPDIVNTGNIQQLSGRASGKSLLSNSNFCPMSLVTVDKDRFSSSMKSDTDTDRRRLLLIL